MALTGPDVNAENRALAVFELAVSCICKRKFTSAKVCNHS